MKIVIFGLAVTCYVLAITLAGLFCISIVRFLKQFLKDKTLLTRNWCLQVFFRLECILALLATGSGLMAEEPPVALHVILMFTAKSFLTYQLLLLPELAFFLLLYIVVKQGEQNSKEESSK